jgi:CBS-domain-containing membrane protein
MATRYRDRDYERGHYDRAYYEDRGLIERAGDEVRSWFGDEEAERRRRTDYRRDLQRDREGRYGRSPYDLNNVRAGDVMTRNVVTVHPDDTVERAARIMGECNCGALPVVNDNGRLIGMVTDRDLTIRIAGRGKDPRRARVDECMTNESFACHANDSLKDCMRQMARHQIRRLPIINDRYQVVGIVSQADLARHAVVYQGRGERRAMADVLCAISEPTYTPYR